MLTIGTPVQGTTSQKLLERRPEPANATVTYDAVKDCYDYEAPGYHHQVCRLNPFKEGATGAAIVGVPSLVGAAETALMGAGVSTLVSVALSPTMGAVMGAVAMGVGAWKATNKNPVFTALAAMLGGGVGAVAWPLLKLPGVWGGVTGALAATGLIGGAAAARAIAHNITEDAMAKEHGCVRP